MLSLLLTVAQGTLGAFLVIYLSSQPREKALFHRFVSCTIACIGNVAFVTAVLPKSELCPHDTLLVVTILLAVYSILQYNHWDIPALCNQMGRLLRKVFHGNPY